MGEVNELNNNLIIGERIKLIRTNLNKSQEEFARDLKMSPSAISAYETAKRPLPDRVIQSICMVYNINKTFIETGQGEMMLSNIDMMLDTLMKYYNLDAADMAIILEYVQAKPNHRELLKNSILKIANTEAFKNKDYK